MGLFDIFSKKTDEYYLKEGNNFFSEKHYAEAVASYDKAIAINPNDANTWYNRGIALNNLGRYSDAVDSYDRAIAIDPNQNNLEIDRDRKIALQHLDNKCG